MKNKRLVFILILALVAVLASACAADTNDGGVGTVPEPNTNPTEPVAAELQTIEALRAARAEVEKGELLTESVFGVPGQVIRVNGADVQLYEFVNEADAQAAAETISPEGSSIGTTMITWIGTPHFYLSGDTIVTYAGDDVDVIQLLETAFGPQFAGGSIG